MLLKNDHWLGVCPSQWSCPCTSREYVSHASFPHLGLWRWPRVCGWLALEAPAQTVQLPTFSFAGVSTTVLVPDRGAAYLGGINRASDGRSEFGVPGMTFPGFQNRGIGQDRSATSFWVTATIHDFDAMDQALLNTPSPDGFAGTYPGMSRGLPETPAAIAGRTFRTRRPNSRKLAGGARSAGSGERRCRGAGQSGGAPGHPG